MDDSPAAIERPSSTVSVSNKVHRAPSPVRVRTEGGVDVQVVVEGFEVDKCGCFVQWLRACVRALFCGRKVDGWFIACVDQ